MANKVQTFQSFPPASIGWIALLSWNLFALGSLGQSSAPFRIEVIERSSQWPVPMVELRTTHEARFVSDNDGVVSFDLPELMNQEVWFFVESPGYEVRPDGFGLKGVRLKATPGGRASIEVDRTMIAKRIGRLTGSGLFAETQKSGGRLDHQDLPWVGCDSVQSTQLGSSRLWLWGDTTMARYPLGNFDMTGATTPNDLIFPAQPPVAMHYNLYLNDQGRPRGMAPIEGEGPTWLTGLATLPDRNGKEHVVACYRKIRPPLSTYEIGLCVWNESSKQFERLHVLWKKDQGPAPTLLPEGHSIVLNSEKGGELLFGNPLPRLRCPATFEDWKNSQQWNAIDAPSIVQSLDRKSIEPHTGSIGWHAARKKWVCIFMENFGKPSSFGELWYCESDSPLGPWANAIKVLSHTNYTFYNPRLLLEVTPPDAPYLLFEGTYTQQFANKPFPTPRYDYNQMLYRVDYSEIDQAIKASTGVP